MKEIDDFPQYKDFSFPLYAVLRVCLHFAPVGSLTLLSQQIV